MKKFQTLLSNVTDTTQERNTFYTATSQTPGNKYFTKYVCITLIFSILFAPFECFFDPLKCFYNPPMGGDPHWKALVYSMCIRQRQRLGPWRESPWEWEWPQGLVASSFSPLPWNAQETGRCGPSGDVHPGKIQIRL